MVVNLIIVVVRIILAAAPKLQGTVAVQLVKYALTLILLANMRMSGQTREIDAPQ